MSATATRQEGVEVYETPITLTTIKAAVTSITDSTKTTLLISQAALSIAKNMVLKIETLTLS